VAQRSESDLNSHLEPIYNRLRNIEAQLAILSAKADVPYATVADVVPAQVIALVRAGDRINAIKAYRELTGASPHEARDVIASL
jgi:ribosomal protein L7/L12